MSDSDAPRHQLRKLCEAMGISLNEPNEQYIPDGYHVAEDGDGERFVKNY